RVSGKTRYETSVAVANTFFADVEEAVVASGKNFPDGLCGGPLAAAMNAPLILTADGKTDAAAAYMADNEVVSGFVLGGTGALADETVVDVFALESAEEIK
ncbi:MAG: cell wall-binding repeat-containing protein, partial [Lachnospiraceae bacterium]|nr:cell wall-binding repeat-containing protein [Lachnospiraceae bacterium]